MSEIESQILIKVSKEKTVDIDETEIRASIILAKNFTEAFSSPEEELAALQMAKTAIEYKMRQIS